MTLSICLLAAVAIAAIAAFVYTTRSKPVPAAPAPTLIGRLMVVHQAKGASVKGLLQTDLEAAKRSGWLVLSQAEYLHANSDNVKAPAGVRIPVSNITSIQDLPAEATA